MDKITGFFNNIFKGKGLSLDSIGGIEGLIKQIGELSKDGQIDLASLKKLVMPYASNFLPGSLKGFFNQNKDKKEMPAEDVMDFFRKNMKEDAAPKDAAPAAAAQPAETPAS